MIKSVKARQCPAVLGVIGLILGLIMAMQAAALAQESDPSTQEPGSSTQDADPSAFDRSAFSAAVTPVVLDYEAVITKIGNALSGTGYGLY